MTEQPDVRRRGHQDGRRPVRLLLSRLCAPVAAAPHARGPGRPAHRLLQADPGSSRQRGEGPRGEDRVPLRPGRHRDVQPGRAPGGSGGASSESPAGGRSSRSSGASSPGRDTRCSSGRHRLVLDAVPEAHAMIVGDVSDGDPAYGDRLRRLAGELGIADRTTFTGYRADVPQTDARRRRPRARLHPAGAVRHGVAGGDGVRPALRRDGRGRAGGDDHHGGMGSWSARTPPRRWPGRSITLLARPELAGERSAARRGPVASSGSRPGDRAGAPRPVSRGRRAAVAHRTGRDRRRRDEAPAPTARVRAPCAPAICGAPGRRPAPG